MKLVLKIAVPCLLFVSFVTSCSKEKCEETVPQIKFVNFIQYQDSGKFIFSFYDCDGDIGLGKEDTLPPYDKNVFLTFIKLENGEWKRFDDEDPPFHYRIPDIESSGPKKLLEGELEITMKPFYYLLGSEGDTIKFEAYIVDKALNKSNVIFTPELVVPPL